MLFKILKDAYKFFDRHWALIIVAAVLSIGLADVLSLVLKITLPVDTAIITAKDAQQFGLDYTDMPKLSDLIETFLLFLASVWFAIFIALTVKAEFSKSKVKFIKTALDSLKLYPRVLSVNLIVSMIMYLSSLLAFPGLTLGFLGILFFIPAIVFAVWFSLISPIAAIDNTPHIIGILRRSRYLVHGYFWSVLLAIALSDLPIFLAKDLSGNSVLYWPISIFINIASYVLGLTIIVSAYANLRLAKGERLSPIPQGVLDKSEEESIDA